MHVMKSFQV